MTRMLLIACLLVSLGGSTWAGPTLTLVLPDPGTYSYWIQAKAGTLSSLPVTVSEKQTVKVAGDMQDMANGDHLLVLDSHTGGVAAKLITLGRDGKPAPIKIALTDFQPLFASASPSSTAPTPSNAAPVAPVETQVGTPVTRLLTGLVSLTLALGVLWLLFHLVQTRGEPLLQLARRAGVEVPEPVAVQAEDVEATVMYTPGPRAPEKIPDEVGLAAFTLNPRVSPDPELTAAPGTYLIGIQGLVAGSTFAVSKRGLTIGRDGDCEIVLAENTVSRRHARLMRDRSRQYWLTDLGSANGIYVNGVRVERASLDSGDEIKIGDNYFRFQAAKEQGN